MVFFYAKYDYKTPGLSGGGIWAYGSKYNGQQAGRASKIPQPESTNKKTGDKSSLTKDDAKNAASERAARFRHATSTSSPTGTFPNLPISTVSQAEALGHITSM